MSKNVPIFAETNYKTSFYKMKKYFSALFLLLFFCVSIGAQKKFHAYAVGFYNLENLFDTCHDAGKNDYQFLPSGSYKWNGMKYSHKLHNMARALSDMGTSMLPVWDARPLACRRWRTTDALPTCAPNPS